MRQAYRRCISVQGPAQEMPVFDARVQVDPRVKDDWGIPVARLSGSNHPHTLEVARFLVSKSEAWLKEAGAITTWQTTSAGGPERRAASGRNLPNGQRP